MPSNLALIFKARLKLMERWKCSIRRRSSAQLFFVTLDLKSMKDVVLKEIVLQGCCYRNNTEKQLEEDAASRNHDETRALSLLLGLTMLRSGWNFASAFLYAFSTSASVLPCNPCKYEIRTKNGRDIASSTLHP